MSIIGIIVGALAVLVSVVGFVIITVGLWKSFARNAFNRAIYLGLALVSTAAIIFSLSGPILVGGIIFDVLSNQGNDEPVASAPVDDTVYEEEEPVEEVVVEEEEPVEDEVIEEDPVENEVVEADPEINITADSLERTSTIGTDGWEEQAQGEYIVVYITASNNSGAPVTVDGDGFTLVGADGTQYGVSSDWPITDDPQIIYEDVNPGNSVTGYILFDVPEGTELASMQYVEFLSDDEPMEITLP